MSYKKIVKIEPKRNAYVTQWKRQQHAVSIKVHWHNTPSRTLLDSWAFFWHAYAWIGDHSNKSYKSTTNHSPRDKNRLIPFNFVASCSQYQFYQHVSPESKLIQSWYQGVKVMLLIFSHQRPPTKWQTKRFVFGLSVRIPIFFSSFFANLKLSGLFAIKVISVWRSSKHLEPMRSTFIGILDWKILCSIMVLFPQPIFDFSCADRFKRRSRLLSKICEEKMYILATLNKVTVADVLRGMVEIPRKSRKIGMFLLWGFFSG